MTSPRTIKIDDVEYVRTDDLPKQFAIQHDNVVLIRTRSAGVHVGEFVSRIGTEVVLKNACRVWRWRGANSLSELSQKGGDLVWTRVSEMVPSIELMECIEIIKCSVDAAKNLRTPRWPG